MVFNFFIIICMLYFSSGCVVFGQKKNWMDDFAKDSNRGYKCINYLYLV